MTPISRANRRLRDKELKRWNEHVAPALASIEQDFVHCLFDENHPLDYVDLFLKYAEIYQQKLAKLNYSFVMLKGDPGAFFKKYSPLEKAAA